MNKTTTSIIAIVLIIASFYGGVAYNKHTVAAAASARASQFGGGARGTFAGRGGATGGGFVSGQIVSADTTGSTPSITVQLMATSSTATTGSAIVFLSPSTTVSVMSAGSIGSLTSGSNVTITGAKNTDGSINATMIQVRQ